MSNETGETTKGETCPDCGRRRWTGGPILGEAPCLRGLSDGSGDKACYRLAYERTKAERDAALREARTSGMERDLVRELNEALRASDARLRALDASRVAEVERLRRAARRMLRALDGAEGSTDAAIASLRDALDPKEVKHD